MFPLQKMNLDFMMAYKMSVENCDQNSFIGKCDDICNNSNYYIGKHESCNCSLDMMKSNPIALVSNEQA